MDPVDFRCAILMRWCSIEPGSRSGRVESGGGKRKLRARIRVFDKTGNSRGRRCTLRNNITVKVLQRLSRSLSTRGNLISVFIVSIFFFFFEGGGGEGGGILAVVM